MADPREQQPPRKDPGEDRSRDRSLEQHPRDVGKTPKSAEGEDPDHPEPNREGPGKTPGTAEG